MFPLGLFISAVVATILTLLWIMFLVKDGQEFTPLLEPLSNKEFPLKELYVIGFSILKTINYNYNTIKNKKKLMDISNVYGERFAGYYFRVVQAQKITFAFSVLLIFSFISIFSVNATLLIFGVFFAIAVFYYVDLQVKDKIEKKEEELLGAFPDVLSKLTLLINAGMIMREAWNKVSTTGNGRLYHEMTITVEEINNGVAEITALTNFGTRCGVTEIKKFTATLVQNLTKGNRELVAFLKQQSHESWETKKHLVRRQGEKASSKMMIPIGVMFAGILVMIVVPIFGNIMN